MTEEEALLEEQNKKKEMLRSYLQNKYSAPVPEEAPPSNENQRIAGDLVTNLGSAFEDFGRAASVARGGARNDGSFYKTVNSQVHGKFDRDEKKLKEDQLKKRQAVEDSFTADVRSRQQQEWADSDADRAIKTADLEAEKDPTSQQSLMAQELAKKLMPSKDFTGMSAAQLKNSIPTLEKLYQIDSKRNDEKRVKTIDQDKIDREMKKERFNLTQDLRKEYTSHPVTKETKDLESNYSRIQKAEKTGAGDQALIFSYMKMLDPTSTVREGEFASAQNTGGAPAAIINAYNKLLNGEMLTEEQRENFRNQSRLYFEGQLERQKVIDDQFGSIAGEAGIDFNQVRRSVSASTPENREQKETKVVPVDEVKKVVESKVPKDKYPLTVQKEGSKTTINNADELAEAIAEGWKIVGGTKQ
jgi:hypothetical protein